MKCPVCSVNLLMNERQGVEIDYCPQCRGVWLDRGELDKLIERSTSAAVNREYDDDDDDYKSRREGYGESHGHSHHKHKRKSFLGELFDFD
jgi:uncharacterized protein